MKPIPPFIFLRTLPLIIFLLIENVTYFKYCSMILKFYLSGIRAVRMVKAYQSSSRSIHLHCRGLDILYDKALLSFIHDHWSHIISGTSYSYYSNMFNYYEFVLLREMVSYYVWYQLFLLLRVIQIFKILLRTLSNGRWIWNDTWRF